MLLISLVLALGLIATLGAQETSGEGGIVMRLAPPAPPRSDATRAADSLAVAETLQNAFGAAAAKALPVVVQVNVVEVVRQNATRSVTPFDYFFGQPGQQQPRRGLGSGVIVGRDGDTVYVLTNNHVAGSASEIQVVLSDKKEYTGKLVGADARLDLALVSFTTKEVVPIAVLGDSANLRVGDWVLAVGNPYGFTGSVTAGIISALNRHADSRTGIADLTDYIQTDASINSGNSGGALVNLRGEVVGINTWIASQSGGSIGIGFSIPINNAKDAITEFIRSGKLVYGWLGVSIVDPTPQATPGLAEDLSLGERTGSFVINVVKGSPADRAGVLPGDYVIRAGDTSILTTQQLTEMVARLKPNTDLPLAVIRQGAERRLGVRILERPAEDTGSGPSNLWPGMLVLPLTETTRSQLQLAAGAQGVVIASMDEQSASGIAGARRGDLVLQLNGSPVGSVSEFYRLLNAAGGREVSLRVQRQGREATVTFRK